MRKELFLISIVVLCFLITGGAFADPPVNDDCADALDVGTLVADSTVQYSGTLVDATQDCSYSGESEVWVKFTLTSCMDVTIDFCDDGNIVESASRYLYTVCPCDNRISRQTSRSCSSNGNPSLTWLNLVAGTYYYPVWSDWGFNSYVINITGANCPVTPENDNCGDAVGVGEVSDLAFSTRAATFDGEGTCTNSPNIWYVYTATFTGDARIDINAGYTSEMAVYDGSSCSPLPGRLGCTINSEFTFAVVNGNQYLIEIGGFEGETGDGTLSIAEAPQAPANDDCVDATNAGILMPGFPVQLSGTLVNATQDCMQSQDSEVWVKFTLASCMDVTIDYCDDENMMIMVPSGDLYADCPCENGTHHSSSESCSFGSNPSLTWLNLETGTYYYPIWPEWGSTSYTININAAECPTAPGNDNCANAIAIGNVTNLAFSTRAGTHDGNGSCISSGPNIWYVYTSDFTGTARLDLSGSDYNTMVAVYDGASCSPLPLEIDCSSEAILDFEVVDEQQYLIEIGGMEDESGNGLLTIGDIPEAPENDNCDNADNGGILVSGSTVQLTGTTEGATLDCMLNDYPEVWIKFTLETCMNITIDFCDNTGYVSSYCNRLNGDCMCFMVDDADITGECFNFNPSLTWNNVEAGTYYYAIYPYNGNGGDYVVNVTGENCQSAPDPDFTIEAPYTSTNSTCEAGDDCFSLYDGEDHIYQVSIPSDGNWLFALCNSPGTWESKLYLGTSVCENDIVLYNFDCGDYNDAGIAYGLSSGTYYLTIDSPSGECGEYTLDITSLPLACDNSYYTNSDPDYENGIFSYREDGLDIGYFAADDFTITEDITLDSIKFLCAYGEALETYFENRGDYLIITENEGAPASVLFDGINVSCSRTPTGYNYDGWAKVYAYQFNDLGIELPAGTYFLACRTESSPQYWLTSDSQIGSTAYQKNGNDWILSTVNADLAFCLFASTGGDAYDYLPGDANMSTGNWPPSTIGGDVTYLVNYFRGITAPCMLDGFYASADANGSCSVTGADVTKLVSYFRGMDNLSYCPDYPTTWPPIPDTAPDGWPNCASPVLSK